MGAYMLMLPAALQPYWLYPERFSPLRVSNLEKDLHMLVAF